MNKLLILFLFVIQYAAGNMAKPYVDGTTHSMIFGHNNHTVQNENIDISLIYNDDIYTAHYKITYSIWCDTPEKIPLLFIGKNLKNQPVIFCNGRKQALLQPNPELLKHLPDDNETIIGKRIDNDVTELVYFKPDLQAGVNTITVEYNASIIYNVYGLERNYTLEYALYPSRYWKKFGNININFNTPSNIKINSSNYKHTTTSKGFNFKINTITEDNLIVEFTTKKGLFATILLTLQPIGIASIFTVLVFIMHLLYIKKRSNKPVKRKILKLILESVLISILVFAVFIFSFDFIQFVVGDQVKLGYYFLFIVFLPVFLIIYIILIISANKYFTQQSKKIS